MEYSPAWRCHSTALADPLSKNCHGFFNLIMSNNVTGLAGVKRANLKSGMSAMACAS
jgi:hypothetical protein